MNEEEARRQFAREMVNLQSRTPGGVIDKHAEWQNFIAAAIADGKVPASAVKWRCPRSLKPFLSPEEANIPAGKKSSYDKTGAKRAAAYRERVKEGKGKILSPIALDKPTANDLQTLVQGGYMGNEADVVRQAIRDAAQTFREKGSKEPQ